MLSASAARQLLIPKQTLSAVRNPDVWLLIDADLVIEIDPDRRQRTFKCVSARFLEPR